MRLVDLGFAKEVLGKTYTLCGTPEYLPPEVILNQGHAQPVDCWALGVLLHEMMVGRAPFVSADDNQMELYQKILSGALFAELPADAPRLDKQSERHARGLIESLVQRQPEARLTCSAREQTGLMRHAFFAATDWVALQQRKLPAPYVPAIGDALDTRLFEQVRVRLRVRAS